MLSQSVGVEIDASEVEPIAAQGMAGIPSDKHSAGAGILQVGSVNGGRHETDVREAPVRFG